MVTIIRVLGRMEVGKKQTKIGGLETTKKGGKKRILERNIKALVIR